GPSRARVRVSASKASESASCAGVIRRAGELQQILRGDTILASEATVRIEQRRRKLGGVNYRRLCACPFCSVLGEPIAVGTVIDLKKAAPMSAVTNDVIHVRLSGSDGEQEPAG